jgi:site-specific DNA recombinase
MEPSQGSQTRAALYARVSTEEQREGNTIASQVAELEKFAEHNGWAVHARYIDEGWSGALLARPELDRLRDDARQGFFDVVLVNDVDRLARDVAHLGVIKRDLERKRIRIVFRKLPMSSDPTSNLMVNILGSFAEFERELIADRTRRGMRHKVEVRKQYVGCIAPYGYKYLRKDLSAGLGNLEVNPAEAQVVKDIYRWVAEEGLSIQKVAARLTRLKIPTRRGGAVWATCSVHKILRNETYTGIWAYGKGEICEPIKPRNLNPYRKKRTSRRPKPRSEWLKINLPDELKIIPQELWETVQRQIDKNPRLSPRNTKIQYLLQGLLRCEFCSGPLTGTYSKDKYGIYIYYLCSRHCKKLRSIRRDNLENTVWNSVKSALLDPAYLQSRTAAALKRISTESSQIEQRQKDMSLKDIEDQEAKVFKQYQSGKIPSPQLGVELEKLRLARMQILNTTVQNPALDAEGVHAAISEYCERVKAKLKNAKFETKRHILRQLVATIHANNESVRIIGVVPGIPAESSVENYRMIASPLPREQTCNRGGLNFELKAKLPPRKRRWARRPGRLFTIENLKDCAPNSSTMLVNH